MQQSAIRALAFAMALSVSSSSANAQGLPNTGPGPVVTNAAAPVIFGTRAVPIRAERFSECLAQLRQDATGSSRLQLLIKPARALPHLQQLAFVQRAVQARIRWVSDATEWNRHDYWASATETLDHGAGDAEDRAIVKMQALRALGFHNSDLLMTLGRDRVAGPVAVLLVRSQGTYFVLDDTGSAPFPLDRRRNEFQPLISFGMTGAWAHLGPVLTASTASTVSTGVRARTLAR